MNAKTTGMAVERLPQIVEALEYMRRVTGRPRLEVQQLQMLLALYAHTDGVSMGDLARELRVDNSFVSRNARAFGGQSKGREMVVQRIDSRNPKVRLLQLTQAGREVVQTFAGVGGAEIKAPRLQRVVDARVQ